MREKGVFFSEEATFSSPPNWQTARQLVNAALQDVGLYISFTTRDEHGNFVGKKIVHPRSLLRSDDPNAIKDLYNQVRDVEGPKEITLERQVVIEKVLET